MEDRKNDRKEILDDIDQLISSLGKIAAEKGHSSVNKQSSSAIGKINIDNGKNISEESPKKFPENKRLINEVDDLLSDLRKIGQEPLKSTTSECSPSGSSTSVDRPRAGTFLKIQGVEISPVTARHEGNLPTYLTRIGNPVISFVRESVARSFSIIRNASSNVLVFLRKNIRILVRIALIMISAMILISLFLL